MGIENKSFIGYDRAKEMVTSFGYCGSRDFDIWAIDGLCKNYGFKVIYHYGEYFLSTYLLWGYLDGRESDEGVLLWGVWMDEREREREIGVVGSVDGVMGV